MSSRTNLILIVLSLFALADVPSALAVTHDHSMLRRRLEAVELPLADESAVKKSNVQVFKPQMWSVENIDIPSVVPSSESETPSSD